MSWKHPFAKSTITSRFGATANRVTPHRGTDYAPGAEAVIKAVTDGEVALIQWSDVLGWVMVQKASGANWWIGYCHLSCATHGAECDGPAIDGCKTPFKNLKVGSKVTKGVTSVGKVGNTGSASRGAHLHITLGKAVRSVFQGKVYDIEKHIDENL